MGKVLICIVMVVLATAGYRTKLLKFRPTAPFETGIVAQAQNHQTLGEVRYPGPPLHPQRIETWISLYKRRTGRSWPKAINP